MLLDLTELMQDGFFQKVMLSMICAVCIAGLIEFYKTFVVGADQALNGKHPHVHMNPTPPKR